MVASSPQGRSNPSSGGGRSLMEKSKSTPNSSGKKASSGVGDSPSATTAQTTTSHRPPNTSDPLLLSIASRQATLVQQQITLTCYIPSNSVGAVIGRQGKTIAQIQKQAQHVGTSNGLVRLSIVGHQTDPSLLAAAAASGGGDNTDSELEPTTPQPQQQPTTPSSSSSSVPYTYSELDWSSPLWTPVVIRADPCAALTAAQLLRDKVEHSNLDDVVMDVPLGRAKHAAVVGRRGFILANLSADTNVRIMVPRRELRHDVIQLEGDLDNVKQCLDRILGLTSSSSEQQQQSSNKKGKSNNNSDGNRQPPLDKNGEPSSSGAGSPVILNVPVLPSQTKMRTVGRKTDTSIKKKKAGDSWDLTISGSSSENIQSAVAMLKKWVEDNATTSNNNNNKETGESNTANNNSAGTPAKPRGRGRPRNNKNKGNRGGGKGNNSNKAAGSSEPSA